MVKLEGWDVGLICVMGGRRWEWEGAWKMDSLGKRRRKRKRNKKDVVRTLR